MSNYMVNLKINNIPVSVPEGTTILEAAKKLNFRIPTLCYHEDLSVAGNCRVCVVEQQGARLLQAACAAPVAEGMEILTNSNKVRQARKHVIELLLFLEGMPTPNEFQCLSDNLWKVHQIFKSAE